MAHHIAPHLRYCDFGGKTILLDLATNRFRGLTGVTDIAFRAAISGKPVDQELAPTVERLCRDGLLLRSSNMPVAETPPRATKAFVTGSERPSIARLAETLWAAFLSSRFRRMSLIDLERRLTHQRHRGERRHTGKGASIDEIIRAYAAVTVLIPNHDRCLERSVSLAWVCASHGYCAELIIGVSVPPFSAHAWVQLGDTVLNDTVEHVQQYKPIHRI